MDSRAPLRIAVALLWQQDRLVLQLRDFRSDIKDPGTWGFFGGHLDAGEEAETGLRRELTEELGAVPAMLRPVGSFDAEGDRHIIGFAGLLDTPIEDLDLREGQEVGAFAPSELAGGSAYSRRWSRSFPLTPITVHALGLWCAGDPSSLAHDR